MLAQGLLHVDSIEPWPSRPARMPKHDTLGPPLLCHAGTLQHARRYCILALLDHVLRQVVSTTDQETAHVEWLVTASASQASSRRKFSGYSAVSCNFFLPQTRPSALRV